MTYQTRDQWLSTPLGADGRAALRAAIKAHDGWSDYRAARAVSLDSMTTADLIDAALALGVDIAAVTGKAAQQDDDHHKPRPHGMDEVNGLRARFNALYRADRLTARNVTFCNDVFDTIDGKQHGRATVRQFSTIARIVERAEAKHDAARNANPPPAVPAATPTPAQAPAMTPAPAAADTAGQLAALIGQLAGQAMNPAAVRDLVRAEIEAALAGVPTIRIELKNEAGEVRALDGHHHPQFPALLRAASARDVSGRRLNIWLAGEAGSGKSTAGKLTAKALGVTYYDNGALSNAFELVGFIDAGGTYHRTPFRDAFEHGGVYMFDEVDGSDNSALLALNAALANGSCSFPDGRVERHPDCVIMASANTWGLGATAEYVGRAKIDAAFLDRFAVRFFWDYDAALEVAISGNEQFARRVIAARERKRAAGLKVLITPRATQAGAALIAQGFTSDEAAQMTYLANLTADQRRLVEGK